MAQQTARQPRVQPIRPAGRAVSRPNYRPSYRPGYQSRYQPSYRIYTPGYPAPYRPYYTFRPRVRVGFSLWVGYPVGYPSYFRAYAYSYPYPYAGAYPYGLNVPSYPVLAYPAPSVSVVPGTPGGLSFDITPPDAGIYVDGRYFGVVSQFSTTQPPLWLAPGRHHVEIQEPGYETVAFDVEIAPGQVIPYQGDLRQF